MEQTQPSASPEEQESDYEYDLAHEVDPGSVESVGAERNPVSVATESSDTGGDYGYDLAHDVPGRDAG